MLTSLLLTGCTQRYLEELPKEPAAPDRQNQQMTAAQSYYAYSGMADDGNGYYFFAKQEALNKLYYFEIGMDEAQPLCSKINCTHSDETCDACYSQTESLNGYIWYHNTSLYRLERDAGTQNVYLVSFNTDGTNAKRLSVLWNGDNLRIQNTGIMRRVLTMHEGYLYYSIQSDVKESIDLCRIRADGTGVCEKIGELPFEADGRKHRQY